MDKLCPGRQSLDVHTYFLPESNPKSVCVSGRSRWNQTGGCRNEVYCKASQLCFECHKATRHDNNEWKKRKAEKKHRAFLAQADEYMNAPYFVSNFDFLLEATGPEGYRFNPPPSDSSMAPTDLLRLRNAARILVEGVLLRQHEMYHHVHGPRWSQDASRAAKLGPKMVYAEYGGRDSGKTSSANRTSATEDPAFASAQQQVLFYLESTGATSRVHIEYFA